VSSTRTPNDSSSSAGTARRGSALSLPGRLLVGAVGVSGATVVVLSAAVLTGADVPIEWVAFSLLTFVTGFFTLKIPSIDVLLSVSEVFTFSCVLLFGPEMGALTVAVDGLLLSYRAKHSSAQTIFNFGNLTLSVWISGRLFFAAAGVPPLFTELSASNQLIVPLALLAAAYFTLNSGLTATVIAIESRRTPLGVWREHFMALAPTYAAGASVALLLVVALRQVHFSVIALIVPLLLISYLTMRSSFGRLEDSKRHVQKLNTMYLSTVETLATAIDAKDEVTHGHIRRVQAAAVGLAKELGIADETTLKAIEAAALLHDTGKIAVPEHILNKPGKLTAAEFEKMKLHAPIGAEILSSIDFPYPVVPIVRHHHENWDGSGYPDGLKGEQIPIGARILSVVDCFDALTSDRPYRARMTNEAAIAILLDRRGTMYDARIVDAFIGAHARLMPSETPMHPAARAVGGARAKERSTAADAAVVALPLPSESSVSEELLGVSSLARAIDGEASVADVGALTWMMLKQILPCAAMGVFVLEERDDTVRGCYAAGTHAARIRALTTAPGEGVVGWVAANRRAAVNAEPAIDYGVDITTLDPPLQSMVAVPLLHEGRLIAVLSVYATARGAYTDDHARVIDLLAPKLGASLAKVRSNTTTRFDADTSGRRSAVASTDLRLLKGARSAG
jgi:putative nucleotidyltransferase with HDIG domain